MQIYIYIYVYAYVSLALDNGAVFAYVWAYYRMFLTHSDPIDKNTPSGPMVPGTLSPFLDFFGFRGHDGLISRP